MAGAVEYAVGKLIVNTGSETQVFILGLGTWKYANITYPNGAGANYFTVLVYRQDGTYQHINTNRLTMFYP